MLDFTGAVDPASVAIADTLVPEADSQNGDATAEVADDLVGDAGLLRSSGAR